MIHAVNQKYFKLIIPKLKKDTPDELSGCCPVCSDTKNRLHLVHVQDGDYDYVKCFNSGCDLEEPQNMYNFIKIASPGYLNQYKQETFKTRIKDFKNSENLQDIINKAKEQKDQKSPKKTEEQEIPLNNLFEKAKDIPECIEYLKQRHIEPMDDWFFSKDKFFNYNNKNVYLKNFILIPIYNKDKYRGFYSRSIEEKKFSTFLLPNTEKIWIQNPAFIPEIITEGIFDALSTGFDNPAAMLGASLSSEYIKTLPKNTIIATDNDQTGIKKLYGFIKKGFKVFIWPDQKEKDFNEMLQTGYKKQDIKKFIQMNTYTGLMAQVKLNLKEK